MYFINEKAMAMSRDGKSVSFENGLPTLYHIRLKKQIRIGKSLFGTMSIKISMSKHYSVIRTILLLLSRDLKKAKNIIKYLDWRENTFDKI